MDRNKFTGVSENDDTVFYKDEHGLSGTTKQGRSFIFKLFLCLALIAGIAYHLTH